MRDHQGFNARRPRNAYLDDAMSVLLAAGFAALVYTAIRVYLAAPTFGP